MKNLAMIILILLFGCSMKMDKGKKKDGEKIKSVEVKKGSITVKLEETGEIKPIRELEIKSKISGRILKYYVEEGDFIKEDDLIADIEPDYNQAEQISKVKDNLELAKIRLKNKKEDLQDLQKLFEDNFVSSKQLDAAQDALKEAEISFNSAFQQYELVREIESENNVSKLISSSSGTIIQKLVEEGELVISNTGSVTAGTVILKLADLRRMVVQTKISEIDISKIHKGQKAKIAVDAYPYKSYDGTITKIAAMAVDYSNVKVFPIEIEINDVDAKLKPGMTANVTIIGEKRKDILVIPIRAIFADEDGSDIVYEVVNDSIADSILVKTGLNDFQQVEIIEGLDEGMKISLKEPDRTKGKK
ncbi:MAG: efflux RND transporter periplasmic adaptor subunit [Candidatus Cloacimonetes bacterium]|nr:efflux RND transporter periplasmic adaptor subunit [Candidatus Cloacimonadota bacterium]